LDIEQTIGDITDPGSIKRGIQGCAKVYHAAAMVSFWVPPNQRSEFYRVNVQGTANVMAAALNAGVEKVVYTSTISTIGSYGKDNLTREEFGFNLWDMCMDYERSKYSAEFEVWRYASRALPVVAVLPTAPVGARDIKPNPVGKLILDFLSGKLPGYIDGGGNFIDADDVAYGHVLADKHGRNGERYIIADLNISTPDLFKALESISGVAAPKLKLPASGALALARLLEFTSDHITGKPPLFTVPLVKFSSKYYYVDWSKAKNELGFQPRSNVPAGVVKAIRWFLDNGYVHLDDIKKKKIRTQIEGLNSAPTSA
jgi:dihydroflavonol-4-reductase